MNRVQASALIMALAWAGAGGAALKVEVHGIRDPEGIMRLSLFRSAAGYPEENAKATRTLSVPVKAADTSVVAEFVDLEPGPWALAVLHDRNGNRRLDRNVLGVPREGIGASNGAARRFGAPRFEDARFDLTEKGMELQVLLRYWSFD